MYIPLGHWVTSSVIGWWMLLVSIILMAPVQDSIGVFPVIDPEKIIYSEVKLHKKNNVKIKIFRVYKIMKVILKDLAS